jgi:hypothetical protein
MMPGKQKPRLGELASMVMDSSSLRTVELDEHRWIAIRGVSSSRKGLVEVILVENDRHDSLMVMTPLVADRLSAALKSAAEGERARCASLG